MEIKNRFTGNTICTGETLLEIVLNNKANLWGANLRGADLRGADLRGANLRDADLQCANLRAADLRGANLWGADLQCANLRAADLRGANLRGAKYGDNELLIKYFTMGPIGSRDDYLQVFITDKQTILKTGCFSGSIDDLADSTDRHDYIAAIAFINAIIEGAK